MAATGLTRRGSFHILRSVNRRSSCPDLSKTLPRITNDVLSRNLNLMVMNPKAPKIRHLNASNPLLIELEANVQKVQELEYKVLELEKQLQAKELMRKQEKCAEKVREMRSKAETLAKSKDPATAVSEEEKLAFRKRLEEAKMKAKLLSLKTNEEEAQIMRSYHQNKLMLTINQLSKISEENSGDAIKLLDKPAEVDEKAVLFSDIEALVDLVHNMPDRNSLEEEIVKLHEMLSERDSLVKLFSEIQEKYDQTVSTITEVQNTINSVNAVKVKLHANLNMSTSVLKVMQGLESKRKNQNMFVFGPNPIFNSAKELELDYSINNQYVIEMLKELDMTSLVSDNNLKSAKQCKRKYKASSVQVEESLQALQESIDLQTNKITNIQHLLDSPRLGPAQEESLSAFSPRLQDENINTQEI